MHGFPLLMILIASLLFVQCAEAQPISAEHKDALLSMQSRYAGAIGAAVISQMAEVPLSGKGTCIAELTQLPGGQIIRVSLIDCDLPQDLRDQVNRQLSLLILPYRSFEPVFQRQVKVRLQ